MTVKLNPDSKPQPRKRRFEVLVTVPVIVHTFDETTAVAEALVTINKTRPIEPDLVDEAFVPSWVKPREMPVRKVVSRDETKHD